MTESNFHKWNEDIYYEVINLICSNEGITYKDLLTILDKQKERFHLKYTLDENYHEAIEDVIMDLIEHDVLEGPKHEVLKGPILLTPQSSLKSKEHIPLGTDLFEYLRDKGVI